MQEQMKVNQLILAAGIKKEGVDFQSLDGLPAKIFVLILSPKDSGTSYLQKLKDILLSIILCQSKDYSVI